MFLSPFHLIPVSFLILFIFLLHFLPFLFFHPLSSFLTFHYIFFPPHFSPPICCPSYLGSVYPSAEQLRLILLRKNIRERSPHLCNWINGSIAASIYRCMCRVIKFRDYLMKILTAPPLETGTGRETVISQFLLVCVWVQLIPLEGHTPWIVSIN